ncbi:hypothetical protein N7540_000259 [Penicillium herquei]|nr:hypothetical protein N7540_000259 [Penicillium herquei]
MQFTLTSVTLLLAGMVSASSSSSAAFTPITSVPSFSSIRLPPSSVVESLISAIPSASRSSIIAAESSAAAQAINSDNYDCVYKGYGCDWRVSDYSGGGSSCGPSPFTVGEELSDGHKVLAISQDGSGDCYLNAGSQCCRLVAENPCYSGYKYLDCVKA